MFCHRHSVFCGSFSNYEHLVEHTWDCFFFEFFVLGPGFIFLEHRFEGPGLEATSQQIAKYASRVTVESKGKATKRKVSNTDQG